MKYIIRPLGSGDESFLWEMLYQALHVPEGQPALSREIVHIPELGRYVKGWGREGDCGFLSSNAITSQPMGAVWLRLPIGEHKGYGYVDDSTPELSMAVLPEYRGQGAGTQLLTHLLSSDCGKSPISLSVSAVNPAVRLYERFGFKVLDRNDESFTMKRDYQS
ncbi:MAG: GNAT family N-acetyltransferase [Cyanobacteria bacterium P01_H01_bin.105]